MSVTIDGAENFPLTISEVERLWQATIHYRQMADAPVAVRCVLPEEMRMLNNQYRGKDRPTNVLTFSYPPTSEMEMESGHDIALCLDVAQAEAKERQASLPDYTALLLVHAFLHASGMDHERSAEEAQATTVAEKEILQQAGFQPVSL